MQSKEKITAEKINSNPQNKQGNYPAILLWLFKMTVILLKFIWFFKPKPDELIVTQSNNKSNKKTINAVNQLEKSLYKYTVDCIELELDKFTLILKPKVAAWLKKSAAQQKQVIESLIQYIERPPTYSSSSKTNKIR